MEFMCPLPVQAALLHIFSRIQEVTLMSMNKTLSKGVNYCKIAINISAFIRILKIKASLNFYRRRLTDLYLLNDEKQMYLIRVYGVSLGLRARRWTRDNRIIPAAISSGGFLNPGYTRKANGLRPRSSRTRC